MIKLLFDPDTGLESHAKQLVNKYAERSMMPRLGSNARALTPDLCDDCGGTYWHAVDAWPPHKDCPAGKPKQGAGFGG